MDGQGVVKLTSPCHVKDNRQIPVGVDVLFQDGRTVAFVTLVVDVRPVPVSAVLCLSFT